MIVGIDFDRVLFDTKSFKFHLEKRFPRYIETYPADKQLYQPSIHAKRMGISVNQLMQEVKASNQFLRSDVSVLDQLVSHNLVIVSRGDKRFQLTKIEYSGITDVIDSIYIVQTESKSVAPIDILIDDRRDELGRAGLPGLLFDSDIHDMQSIVSFVDSFE